jgi:hypothetical protein
MTLKDLLKDEVNVEELMEVKGTGDINATANCEYYVCSTAYCAGTTCSSEACTKGIDSPPPTSTPPPTPPPTPPCSSIGCMFGV